MAFSELIAVYLFLAGAAAGAFALVCTAGLIAAFRRWHHPRQAARSAPAVAARRLSLLATVAALIMMVAALLCLLADLGRPQAFFLLFVSPTGSPLSVGAFALTLLTACMAVDLADQALALGPFWSKAALVAKVLGIVFAFVVMIYAGVLLQTAIAVPLWHSGWLWVLFLFSSLSCGCAVVLLCACACEGYGGIGRLRRRVVGLDGALIVLEAVVTIAFILTVGADAPVNPIRALADGGFAALFWLGFIGCGILVPLAFEVPLLVSGRSFAVPTAVLATFVLVGGLCLRLVMVGAGTVPVI